jgi:polyisoprenyl-teichoic acid--peptidoglycan teichoic acid transferase
MKQNYNKKSTGVPAQRPGPVFPPETIEQMQRIHVPNSPNKKRSGGFRSCTCLLSTILLAGLFVIVLLAAYFLSPVRTNLLILGIDRVPEGTALGRSDTMILVSVIPLKPTVSMLSIPRDLWVSIPGIGENRINTAHFYAEAEQAGSGPAAAVQTVEENFNIQGLYYVRLRFDAFLQVIDAMGGVSLSLPEDMGGLPAGQHHLDGTGALAFVRHRKNSDDFFRMAQSQFMMRTVIRQIISPVSWPRMPAVIEAVFSTVDTNLPVWQWPRIGLAILRAGQSGINSRTIDRTMTTDFTTDQGANVLMPDWTLIQALVGEMMQE